VAGLRIEAIDAGARLRLRNATGQEVVVLGYAGEPYLRVGPAGCSRTAGPGHLPQPGPTSPMPAPAQADPAAPPQ